HFNSCHHHTIQSHQITNLSFAELHCFIIQRHGEEKLEKAQCIEISSHQKEKICSVAIRRFKYSLSFLRRRYSFILQAEVNNKCSTDAGNSVYNKNVVIADGSQNTANSRPDSKTELNSQPVE